MDFTTSFAPADLASTASLQHDYRTLTALPGWQDLLAQVNQPLMILNPERQVVLANRALLELLGNAAFSAVVGRRPGELLHCEVSERTLLGCGTSHECRQCLAIRTVQESVVVHWARAKVEIHVVGGAVLTFGLTATTLTTESRRFTAVTLNP